MNKVIIVGGGAAGMMAAISASKEKRSAFLKRTKNLARSFLLRGKADAILQMPVRQTNFLLMW